jgi:dTDP-4-dehydrorhamnose reductase
MARTRPDWLPQHRPFLESDAFGMDTASWRNILKEFDSVVYLAFPTNLDSLENISSQESERFLDGYRSFLEAAAAESCPTLFFSSDAVLWGIPAEERVPGFPAKNTLNRYAFLKSECETLTICSRISTTYVVRCIPVGLHPFSPGHGFVGSVLTKSLSSKAVGFHDTLFNPVSLPYLNALIGRWVAGVRGKESNPLGKNPILHLASRDALSKYEFLLPLVGEIGGVLEKGSIHDISFKAKRTNDQRIFPSELQGIKPLEVKDIQSSILEQIKFCHF